MRRQMLFVCACASGDLWSFNRPDMPRIRDNRTCSDSKMHLKTRWPPS